MRLPLRRALLAYAILTALLQGCTTPQAVKPPEALFKDGEEFFRNGNYEDAIAQWKKVKESFQSSELMAQAEIGIADAQFLNKDFIEAAVSYEDFRKLHPTHPKAGYALFRQGLSHYNQIHGVDTDQSPVSNSLATFESYLKLYPVGEHAAEVREKVRDCREKQLQYEIYVGRFYLRTGKYPAAIGRFEQALKVFSDLQQRDELLFYLGQAYLESGQKSKGREIYGRLMKEFPESSFISEANKVMDKHF